VALPHTLSCRQRHGTVRDGRQAISTAGGY
jgi:hypothetical protein